MCSWRRRQPCVRSAATTTALVAAVRDIVQSKGAVIQSNPFDWYEHHLRDRTLLCNGQGNYYRYRQKLWPSEEAMERALSEHLYSSVERTPLALLPQRASPQSVFACEGRGGVALLDDVARSLDTHSNNDNDSNDNNDNDNNDNNDDDVDALRAAMDVPLRDKTLSDDAAALQGSVLASARARAREVIAGDLSVNTLATPPTGALDDNNNNSSTRSMRLHVASAREPAPATPWSALGLDPALCAAATRCYGAVPTRLQTRLLPALLNEDHNDVVFNGVTGSGKTTALLLAILHGIRNEAAGMNVLVAANAMCAMRMHDAVRTLCRRSDLGGRLVDRPRDDYSWLFIGCYREDHARYAATLRRSLRAPHDTHAHGDDDDAQPARAHARRGDDKDAVDDGNDSSDSQSVVYSNAHGAVRLLITTADVLCELLFEDKMQFASFGYLRRVYVDDVAVQLPMLPPTAPVAEARERLRHPLAAELLLGTLHQLPGPHIRSLLQLGLVSADVDGALKQHLLALCVKPHAHTVVLAPIAVPATVHCVFSFYTPSMKTRHDKAATTHTSSDTDSSDAVSTGRNNNDDETEDELYAYTARLLWAARASIPGRVLIVVHADADMLRVRRRLRAHGLNAKLFSEVYADGVFRDRFTFLLLKESEAFGLDVPLVSHVVVTFVPRTWQSFLHLCGRVGRVGNVGWVYAIAARSAAAQLRRVAHDCGVDMCTRVVDAALRPVEAAAVEQLTRAPSLYGLDPQYAVQQHYDVQSEAAEAALRPREFFDSPPERSFQLEDYTPTPVLHRRVRNAHKLARDIASDPRRAAQLQRDGLLDAKMRPTAALWRSLEQRTHAAAPSPFDPRRRL